MLTDQNPMKPPLIGLGHELFFLADTMTPDWEVLNMFRTVIQCPGFFKFVFLATNSQLAIERLTLVRNLGVSFVYTYTVDLTNKSEVNTAKQIALNCDFVYSPELARWLNLPNAKRLNVNKETVISCLAHFNKYIDAYTTQAFLKQLKNYGH